MRPDSTTRPGAAPGLWDELAHKILSQLFASGRPWPVVLVALVMTALNLFASSLFELTAWIDDRHALGWIHLGLGFLAFPLLLGWLIRAARKARQRLRPVVKEDRPQPVRGLILYLSVLQADHAEKLADPRREKLDLAGFRLRYERASWRMPVEAVAHHAGRLDYVVVIPSQGAKGSAEQLPRFRELLSELFPAAGFRRVDIGQIPPSHPGDGDYQGGLDFEGDSERLAAATDDAYDYLRGRGLEAKDILIDITGGQKTTSIVGSAVALAEGRRIQYVSTHDYGVRVYDVSYGM